MNLNLNRSPYFDDYDEDKKFHRILYRPEYAVQARELTQQQTILQNQAKRHGDHIFKNGAMVIPGQITFDPGSHYVKINPTFDSANIDISQFTGNKLVGATSGVTAECVNVSDVEGTDPKTLYVKYTGGSADHATFMDGEIIQLADDPGVQCQVQGTIAPVTYNSTGLACASSIEAGIYYINGFFVVVNEQTIIVSKYSNVPSVRVGLKLYETIVAPEDDSSLNDNAQGSYNYAAPGAHRYKLELLLEKVAIDDAISDDFIELQRIENGIIINEIRTTEYNELEKTLARRTFDESGDYTVSPFQIDVREHLRDTSVTRLAEGKYLLSEGGDETKLAIGLEPGKAYVRGFERVKLATTWIETNKARTVGVNNNSVTNFNIGQYVYVTQCFQMPDFSIYDSVDLYDTEGTDGVNAGSIIGTAKVRAVELYDSTGAASAYVYRIYLFDIVLDADKAWSEVLWISSNDASTTFTCKTTIGGDYDGLDLQIIEPTNKASIFKMPHNFTKTLKIDGSSDTSYTVQRTYSNVGVASKKILLSAGGNAVFNAFTGSNYILMDLAATSAVNAFIPITPSNVTLLSGGTNLEIDLTGLGAPWENATNVRVIVPVVKQVATERSKTLVEDWTYSIPPYQEGVYSGPNTLAGEVDLLDRADVYRIKSIISDPDGSAYDVTDRYDFDSGQRDAYYDLGRIKLKLDAQAPDNTKVLRIVFDYFSHSAGDYCSVDSYSTLDYYDIPAYYSEDIQYDLSDCVDFRPVINASGSGFSGSGALVGETPYPKSNIRSDYEFYLSRIDKLYIDYTGKFSIIEGTPAEYPEPPKSPDDGMVLFEINMNAYTYSPSEARPVFIDNKRYTMRDIGDLEERISNLEYYTSLSLLEKETSQLQIKDGAGLDRFKNGFIVEPFSSHGIGEVLNNDYKCSVDPLEEVMRPTFSSDSNDLELNAGASVNTVQTGPLITLPFTEKSFISQKLASTTENVNPFAVRVYEGAMTFQPDSDNWYDTKKNGELVVNNDAHYEALEFMATYGKGLNGVQWNSWQDTWSSRSTKNTTTKTKQVDRTRRHDTERQVRINTTSLSTTTTTTKQRRTGTKTTHSSTVVNRDMGDRTVGINYIPYMRSIPVLVKVEQMKPDTKLYPFFDDVDILEYCTPAIKVAISGLTGKFTDKVNKEEIVTTSSGGSAVVVFSDSVEMHFVNWNGVGFADGETITGADSGATAVLGADLVATSAGDPITTDAYGRIALIFNIPNNDDQKFRTGERVFLLSDQIGNTEANQTKAQGIFKSQGSLLQQEGTVLSTKTIRFNQTPLSQSRTKTSVSQTSSTTNGRWYDPLAQTILIEEEGGCFITKCDIYFKNKDEKLPVNFQIREVVNGYPGQAILPYSETTLYPEDITTSEDGSEATAFVLPAPVYLQQGTEYCFVLLSDSFEYNVWIGELGQVDIISNELISKQPYNGVLFKSQNASTWTANQQQDLKFALHKAVFDIEVIGMNMFDNVDIPIEYLDLNPFETFNGSTQVRVHHFAHAMPAGSTVIFSDIEEGPFNDIPGAELNGSHIISNVETDSYTILVTTPAVSDGRTGGNNIKTTRNIQMDVMRPNISEMVLPGTASSWESKTTTHKSVNGSQTPYVKGTSFDGINITENNFFRVPMMMASNVNETNLLGGNKSLTLRNYMLSTNKNLSPVIDMNRAAVIAVANRIDSPSTVNYDATDSFVTTIASPVVTVSQTGHGMATGAIVSVSTTETAIDGIPQASLTGDFSITRIDDDTYSIVTDTNATAGDINTGDMQIVHSNTHYLYIPETTKSGGAVGAKYITRKITVDDPAVALKLFFTAVVMDKSEIEIYYKTQGPYDTTLFSDLPWVELTSPDAFVPLSENEADFREYEYTKEFAESDEFTSISIKLVMKSVDSTRVPIFDDLRVICLGS